MNSFVSDYFYFVSLQFITMNFSTIWDLQIQKRVESALKFFGFRVELSGLGKYNT